MTNIIKSFLDFYSDISTNGISSKFKKLHSPFLPILFIVFIDTLGYGIVIPVLTTLLFEANGGFAMKGFSQTQLSILYGVIASVYPLAQFFGASILGALSDRYGRKPLLLISITGTFIGYIITALGILITNIPLLLGGRLLDGFTGGNISIAFSATADMSKDDQDKSKRFGFVGLAYALGLILGPYFGGKLSNTSIHRWFVDETPFLFAAFCAFICLIFLYYGYKETLKKRLNTDVSLWTGFRHIGKAFKIQQLRSMFLTIFLFIFGFTIFVNFMPVLMQKKFNFHQAQIGTMFAYAGIWAVIGLGIINTLLLKKFTSRQLILVTPLLLALVYPLCAIMGSGHTIFLIIPFISIFHGMNQTNSTSVISSLSSEETQGEVLGINQSVQSLAQSLPSLLGGLALSKHLEWPIWMAMISTFIAWIILMATFLNRKVNKDKQFHN